MKMIELLKDEFETDSVYLKNRMIMQVLSGKYKGV